MEPIPIEPIEPTIGIIVSRNHKDKQWAGPIVTLARKYWHRRLVAAHLAGTPIKCPKCGLDIKPDDKWDVGHVIALNDDGPIHLSNTHPEHSRCNRGDGARMTNEIKRRKRGRVRKW